MSNGKPHNVPVDLEWLQSLAAVALGGGLAAWAGKASAERASRTEALVALKVLSGLQSTPDAAADLDQTWRKRLQARMALVQGGVPWVFVELIDEITQALILTDWAIDTAAKRGEEAQRSYASKMKHPSRRGTRPLVQYAALVEEAIAERLEQPLRARCLGHLRRWQLRRALRAVANDNEYKRIPKRRVSAGASIPHVDQVSPHLTWPARNLRLWRPESAVQVPEGFWPRTAGDDDSSISPG